MIWSFLPKLLFYKKRFDALSVMSKFTFFTILFSLTIIVIVGQLVLRDALFPKEYQTEVLQEASTETVDISTYESEDGIPILSKEEPTDVIDIEFDIPPLPHEEPLEEPPEIFGKNPITQSAFLNKNLLQRVGFSEITVKAFRGKIFDLFDISKQRFSSVLSFEVKENNSIIATVTEIEMPDEISAQELYRLIQNKSKVYIDLFVNETNTYGDRSFYVNHQRKPDEAFLIVRMRNYLYTLAYFRDYHSRIKTLISFLYTAILDRP